MLITPLITTHEPPSRVWGSKKVAGFRVVQGIGLSKPTMTFCYSYYHDPGHHNHCHSPAPHVTEHPLSQAKLGCCQCAPPASLCRSPGC